MSQSSSASAPVSASTASTAPPPYLYCGTSRESSAVSFSASGYLTCAQPLTPLSSSSSSSSTSSSWSAKASSASSADDGSATPRMFKNLVVARGCTIDIYAGRYTTIASRTSLNIHVNISCISDFSFFPYA